MAGHPNPSPPDTIGASGVAPQRGASCYHSIFGSHHMADEKSELEQLKAENARLRSERYSSTTPTTATAPGPGRRGFAGPVCATARLQALPGS